jgi:hypothetical protein
MGQLKTITHASFGVLTEVDAERLAGRFEGSIDFLGDSIATFFFDDSDLFWGHTIVAEYFNIEASVTLPTETKGRISLFG